MEVPYSRIRELADEAMKMGRSERIRFLKTLQNLQSLKLSRVEGRRGE